MPSSVSSRESCRLTIDLDTPSRRAAAEIPPASAISTNVRNSSVSNSAFPILRHNLAQKGTIASRMGTAKCCLPGSAALGECLPENQPHAQWGKFFFGLNQCQALIVMMGPLSVVVRHQAAHFEFSNGNALMVELLPKAAATRGPSAGVNSRDIREQPYQTTRSVAAPRD